MVKKMRLFTLMVLSGAGLTFLQETKAADPLSIIVMGKAVMPVAKYLVPIGALGGYVLWTRAKYALFNKHVRKNGEGIAANGKKLDLLRGDIAGLKKGQHGMRTQLHDLAQDWHKGQKRLEDGHIKLHGSLGNLEANVTEIMIELKQGQEGQHKEVRKDLHNLQTQLSHFQRHQKEISGKQDEILGLLDAKNNSHFLQDLVGTSSYFSPFAQSSLKDSSRPRNT